MMHIEMTQSGSDLWLSIQAFLFREARLLDDGKFGEWASLFTSDGQYILPIEGGPPSEPAIIRDSRERIEERVYRIVHTIAHAQRPLSRTQHDVTNIEFVESNHAGEVTVLCNQAVHELRPGNPMQAGLANQRSLYARCRYRLVAAGEDWLIKEKRCDLLNRDFPIYNLTFIF